MLSKLITDIIMAQYVYQKKNSIEHFLNAQN